MEPVKDRIYAFDTIRTVMVLLGIVIHASMLYQANFFNVFPFYSDPKSQSAAFNIVGDVIHIFRMPVFFSISGFFTALIFFERGVSNLVSNRLRRLVYPFVAGVIVIVPMHVFSLNFFALGLAGIQNRYALAWKAVGNIRPDEIQTAHLWFLYYLIGYCVTVLVVACGFERWSRPGKSAWLACFKKCFNWKAAPVFFCHPDTVVPVVYGHF